MSDEPSGDEERQPRSATGGEASGETRAAIARPPREVWTLMPGWSLSALAVGALLATLETTVTSVMFPATLSDPLGAAATWLGLWGVFAIASLPAALVVGAVWRKVVLPAAENLLGGALGLAVTLWALRRAEGRLVTAIDFPSRVEWVAVGLALLSLLFGVSVGWGTRAALRRFGPSLPLPSSPLAFGVVAASTGLVLCFVAWFGAAAVHVKSLVIAFVLFAVALWVAALAPVVAKLGVVPRRPLVAAWGVLVASFLVWPLHDPHARLLMFSQSLLASPLLEAARDRLDLDGDGASGWWLGGEDCDDFDASRSPYEREVPADGIDQDCRGGDAPAPPPEEATGDLCPVPDKARSMLLITIDAARVDSLSPQSTPALAQFAMESQLFLRAYSPTTLTRTTFVSMFAGMPMTSLTASNPVASLSANLPETFPEQLRKLGVRTGAINYFELPRELLHGFDDVNRQPMDAYPGPVRVGFASANVTNGVLAYLDAHRGEKVFLWAHYPDPHAPYLDVKTGKADESREGYVAELTYTDRQLARLFSTLASQGRLDDYVIAVTADHGEELGYGGHPQII